jgi:Leucine-rich repeat (LRR) protein
MVRYNISSQTIFLLKHFLSTEFEALTKLKTLDASKNRFDIVPDVIFRLVGLETFCFSENLLFEWPKNLMQLTTLTYLDLSGNNLQNYISDQYGSDHGDMVPENAFSSLSLLTHLDLCNCGLMALPLLSHLARLDTILLNSNNLTTVPSLPSSIRKIDVAFNLFATVRLLPFAEEVYM